MSNHTSRSTGYKDKHGREILEGHVIESQTALGNPSDKNTLSIRKGIVFWSEESKEFFYGGPDGEVYAFGVDNTVYEIIRGHS